MTEVNPEIFEPYGPEGFWLMNGRQDALNGTTRQVLVSEDAVYQNSYDEGYRYGLYWKPNLLRDTL